MVRSRCWSDAALDAVIAERKRSGACSKALARQFGEGASAHSLRSQLRRRGVRLRDVSPTRLTWPPERFETVKATLAEGARVEDVAVAEGLACSTITMLLFRHGLRASDLRPKPRGKDRRA